MRGGGVMFGADDDAHGAGFELSIEGVGDTIDDERMGISLRTMADSISRLRAVRVPEVNALMLVSISTPERAMPTTKSKTATRNSLFLNMTSTTTWQIPSSFGAFRARGHNGRATLLDGVSDGDDGGVHHFALRAEVTVDDGARNASRRGDHDEDTLS